MFFIELKSVQKGTVLFGENGSFYPFKTVNSLTCSIRQRPLVGKCYEIIVFPGILKSILRDFQPFAVI